MATDEVRRAFGAVLAWTFERRSTTTMVRPQTSLLQEGPCFRVHDDVESGILIDGRDYFRAFFEAASRAKRSILLLGWQFDSDVELLRGDDRGTRSSREVELLTFLRRLRQARPELSIYVLAWNHSVVFSLEREPLQSLAFGLVTSSRFVFRWDDSVPFGSSHHQKVAIIDGVVAFVGSQDLCHSRWDDSTHLADDERRTVRGFPYGPYHEVQVVVTGHAARSLVDLFVWRWWRATGEHLDRGRLVVTTRSSQARLRNAIPVTMPMPRARIGLVRTFPASEKTTGIFEIRSAVTAMIRSAERLVYCESQYVTSTAVLEAFVSRMRDASKPKLEIVIVLPRRPENFKELVAVGVPQADVLRELSAVASQYGHALGLYNVEVSDDCFVYVHSKVLVIDDRRLVVGSANLTNRSMVGDSEIAVVYEANESCPALSRAIRRVRVRLLWEHTGGAARAVNVARSRGLVARLDALASSKEGRLRRVTVPSVSPNALVRRMHELAVDVLDPPDVEGRRIPQLRIVHGR